MCSGVEPEPLEFEFDARTIENAHDDALTEHGRDGRNTKVDIDATHCDLDAAILRHPSFSDVQLGHDLYSRGDGRP
jgi:hypothetical protein